MLSLMIIDMQKWMFRYPERAAQVPSLIRAIDSLSATFVKARLPIFHVDTVHKADRSTWSRLMKKYDYPCLIEGTDDAAPVSGYRPPQGAIQIAKTANSAFVGTDLEERLAASGISELVLAGVFIDGCVGITAADAAQRGYEVVLVQDAIGHVREDRGAVIFEWLVSDWDLSALTADQVRERVDQHDPRLRPHGRSSGSRRRQRPVSGRLCGFCMKLAASITRSLQTDMQAELRDIERAVASGTRDAGRGLKAEPRRQVSSAGLGQRLANSWRDQHYPNQRLDAASLVYTRAPQIIRVFDESAVIRSRRGRFLAIPTENAPRKSTDGKRVRPSTFPEHRFGPLRFVPRPIGPSFLVVDGLRASFRRKTGQLRGSRRATDRARRSGQGLTTVVMFLLVPQAKLSKRLDVARAAEHWLAQLPALIEQQLRSE